MFAFYMTFARKIFFLKLGLLVPHAPVSFAYGVQKLKKYENDLKLIMTYKMKKKTINGTVTNNERGTERTKTEKEVLTKVGKKTLK